MSTYWYGNALVRAFTELDAGGSDKTPTVMLLSDGHVYDSADVYVSDVSADEASGTGYTAGGLDLSGVTYTFDDVTGVFSINADDLTPGGLSVNARYMVVYYDTGTPTTSPLVCITDLTEVDGEEETVTGISVHASGFVTVQVSLPA